jgi:nanoRNase/pAp phosphatase (c-di-AMP/oligoRNAs hydrolase)
MNIAIAGSAAFGAPGWETGALPDDVDICCQYYHNGDVFTISLYSKKGGVDVSAICKSFGGGGHAGAAGFTSKELPAFLRKISDG